jgi:polyisoprenoid-binding protein YceI
MKPRTIYLGTLIAVTALAANRAQAQETAKLSLRPESKLTFEGTSTLHGFTCSTNTFDASVEVDARYKTLSLDKIARPIGNVNVVIPVKSLKCGNGKLESNMYGVLKEKEYPTVQYALKTYELISDSTTADRFVAKTTGVLTIAGKERTVEMMLVGKKTTDGMASATAALDILLTDFDIKPPSFMLGTLKVGNKISLKFDIVADRQTAAAVGVNLP